MYKIVTLGLLTLTLNSASATPVLQMNSAMQALTSLVPYLTNEERFQSPKNTAVIQENISKLQTAFRTVKHDPVLKQDIFAPSYDLINGYLKESADSFKEGKKGFAQWRLKEITSLCLDCHTRMPESHASSFQSGDLSIDTSKFDTPYSLGIAQLIVRRYPDASASFTKDIDEKLIKKNYADIIKPLKQLLLIETKILKKPENLESLVQHYLKIKDLPNDVKEILTDWNKSIPTWKGVKLLAEGFRNDEEVQKFITQRLEPIKKKASFDNDQDVHLLFASGLMSNYIFLHPESKKVPVIIFWIGWMEKYLKREDFFGTGDLFLKQCIRRYPKDPIAQKCFEEYKDSIEFEFTGSSGTRIPDEIKKELEQLKKSLTSP